MAKDDFRGKPLDDGLRGQISETDRAEIYRKVREGIDEILNGGGSYYADGPQRDEFEIGSDLDEFGQFVRGLTTHFGDSDGVLRDASRDLQKFIDRFKVNASENEPFKSPRDPLEISPPSSPKYSDGSVFDPDRIPGNRLAPAEKAVPIPLFKKAGVTGADPSSKYQGMLDQIDPIVRRISASSSGVALPNGSVNRAILAHPFGWRV